MPYNRRRFAGRAVLAAIALPTLRLSAGAPAHAQTPTTSPLEQQSVALMRRRKRLETAIAGLTEAVRREPTARRYRVLLACAQAERAFTLAAALGEITQTAQRTAAQQSSIAKWQSAQSDPQDPLYGKPKPVFPSEVLQPLKTRDDDTPLTLTENAVRDRVKELSRSSLGQLKLAGALPPEARPEVQAEWESLRGWTLLVLWSGPRRIVPESWPAKDGKPQGPEEIITSLERAVALQPDNQGYRLGLADACLIASMDKDSPFLPPTRFDESLFEKGRKLLTEAAKRRPRDAALSFRVACLEGNGSTVMAPYEARTPESIAALRRAAEISSNALAWYCLAAAQSTTRDYAGMMASLERGNTAPTFQPFPVKYAAPTIVAWVFPETTSKFPGLGNLNVMGMMSLLNQAKKNEDTETIGRIRQLARQMSQKYRAATENTSVGKDTAWLLTSASMAKVFAEGLGN